MIARDKTGDSGGRDRNSVFFGFDFFRHADDHGERLAKDEKATGNRQCRATSRNSGIDIQSPGLRDRRATGATDQMRIAQPSRNARPPIGVMAPSQRDVGDAQEIETAGEDDDADDESTNRRR